jgi:hypothetical protein
MKIATLSYSAAQGFSASLPTIAMPQCLVLVFGHSDFADDHTPFNALQTQYPQAIIMGCSSAGEILGKRIHDNTLVIAVISFESSQLRFAHAVVHDVQESRYTGRLLADQLSGENLRGIFVLSDGLHVNGSELAQGFNDVLQNIIVTGGLAGDGEKFSRTWVLQHGKPVERMVTALGLYGNISIGHGSKGGWVPFGSAREVTRATNNVLYELDGQPALALYKKYLGEMANGLPATGLRFPLALSQPGEAKELVRTILAIDETAQSLTFAGDIPVGAYAQLMRANIDQLVEGAENAAIMSATETDQSVLCIAISCVGRRMVMGANAEEETEAVLDILPDTTQQIGFYSYGEISPYAKGDCDLHNQTMTLTTWYEPDIT